MKGEVGGPQMKKEVGGPQMKGEVGVTVRVRFLRLSPGGIFPGILFPG